ncbi:MAG: hypothetical protein JWL73_2100 [Actinomycetia bacterium]|nr:hypothetical protein [Actinomycetes bacterium]
MVDVPENIVCVDCGGKCHLLTHRDDEIPFRPGDIVAYRCEDCVDRWDVVVPDEDDEAAAGDRPSADW